VNCFGANAYDTQGTTGAYTLTNPALSVWKNVVAKR